MPINKSAMELLSKQLGNNVKVVAVLHYKNGVWVGNYVWFRSMALVGLLLLPYVIGLTLFNFTPT